MKTSNNPVGGVTVTLFPGEDLGSVPKSHRNLVSADLVRVHADPLSHFSGVAHETPIVAMSQWLRFLVDNGKWSLELSTTFEPEWSDVAFHLSSLSTTTDSVVPHPLGAAIGLAVPCDLQRFPEPVRRYYQLVGVVRWRGFGEAGDIYEPTRHSPITDSGYAWQSSSALDKSSTLCFGSSENGTPLIYTPDGKAGWWTYESRHSGLQHSFEEMLEWIYSELLAGRAPVSSD